MPKNVLPISVVVVDAKVVAIVAGVVIGGASVVVQVNNFQKVFFVYHSIKEFEWKFFLHDSKGGKISEGVFNLVRSSKKQTK